MQSNFVRIGQIVPSSNITMETEIPELLNRHKLEHGTSFTFHSSRMRMQSVSREELAKMNAESGRCALELSDARVDILGYACLVAIMSSGRGYHRTCEPNIETIVRENHHQAPVVTSAGALIDALNAINASTILLVAPYVESLTKMVVNYIEDEDIMVKDYRTLSIADNLEVGNHDPLQLPAVVNQMDLGGVDAIVLSACVQMPSLRAVPLVEAQTQRPVITAAIATTWAMLKKLNLDTYVPGGGALLSGRY